MRASLWTPRRVEREAARVGDAAARWIRRAAGPAAVPVLAGRPIRVRVVRVGGTADADGAVAVIRGGGEPAMAIGGGALVRGLAQAILGGPAELAAPRPPTVAEQAVWTLAVATALAPTTLTAEPSLVAPGLARGTLIELAVEIGELHGPAWLAAPALAAPPAVALGELARGAAWLDAVMVTAPVVIAHAGLTVDEIDALAERDAIVVGAAPRGSTGSLRVGRGAIAVDVDPGGGDRVTVRAAYQRGVMDETLGDDLTVEVAVSTGTVAVSARRLLELAPGAVLPLARPASGAVELLVGGRLIGRGELIDVDGELAVRVTALADRPLAGQ
jgi:hypothetical protein